MTIRLRVDHLEWDDWNREHITKHDGLLMRPSRTSVPKRWLRSHTRIATGSSTRLGKDGFSPLLLVKTYAHMDISMSSVLDQQAVASDNDFGRRAKRKNDEQE